MKSEAQSMEAWRLLIISWRMASRSSSVWPFFKLRNNYPLPGLFAEALDGVDAELAAFPVNAEGLPEVDELLGRVDDDLHVFICFLYCGCEVIDVGIGFQAGAAVGVRRIVGHEGGIVQDIAAGLQVVTLGVGLRRYRPELQLCLLR